MHPFLAMIVPMGAAQQFPDNSAAAPHVPEWWASAAKSRNASRHLAGRNTRASDRVATGRPAAACAERQGSDHGLQGHHRLALGRG